MLVIFLLSYFAHTPISYLTAAPRLCFPWSVPVFFNWTSVKVTTFALSIYLWEKRRMTVHSYCLCEAHSPTSFCPHLRQPSVDHFSLFWFQFTFSPSALLFLFIRIGKIDYGVINQKWSGVEEQCCGSLRKPPCPLFPLGHPYSITLPYVLTPSFHFSVCCLCQFFFLKFDNSK